MNWSLKKNQWYMVQSGVLWTLYALKDFLLIYSRVIPVHPFENSLLLQFDQNTSLHFVISYIFSSKFKLFLLPTSISGLVICVGEKYFLYLQYLLHKSKYSILGWVDFLLLFHTPMYMEIFKCYPSVSSCLPIMHLSVLNNNSFDFYQLSSSKFGSTFFCGFGKFITLGIIVWWLPHYDTKFSTKIGKLWSDKDWSIIGVEFFWYPKSW